jgi:heme exporter protein A
VTPSDVQDDGALVQLTNVYKRFGRRIALRGVSFGLSTGEAVAVLGANGAGKTTMLRTAATLARPTRGSVTAFGVDAWAERVQVRARLGVVAHQPYVYPELTCAENLEFFAAMFKVGHREQVVAGALERVGLAARSGQRAGELSRGLLQRLNIARATLHDPPVLILDEPDTGLDAAGRAVLAEIIGTQSERGGCVMFTTHSLDLAMALATRVVVIRAGAVGLDADRGDMNVAEVAGMMTEAPGLVGA